MRPASSARREIQNVKTRKVHVLRTVGNSYSAGGRSRCRYSSRPSRRVRALPEHEFLQMPVERQCEECRKAVAPNGTIRAQVAPGKWENIPVRETEPA